MSSSVRKVKNRVPKNSLRESLKDEKKRIRFFLLLAGILFVLFGLYRPALPSVPKGNNTWIEVTSFSQEPVQVDKQLLNTSKDKNKKKIPPLRILIPALAIDLPVKEARIINGYWEVFPDTAGFGSGSAYPDEAGNQVIFAHAREGLFLPLRKAKVEQMIYVITNEKWYSYKIEEVKEVLPSQTEVIGPTPDTILTLYTCSGYADSKRLIVKAKKI